MSNIVLEYQKQHFPLERPPHSFENLISLIKEKIGSDVNFRLHVIDEEGDGITLATMSDLQVVIQYHLSTQQKSKELIIHVEQLKSLDREEDPLSSTIIDRSLVEQKRKVEQLKKDMDIKPRASLPNQQVIDESLYQKPVDKLSLDYIIDYYKGLLTKYEVNYKQQTSEQKIQQEVTYRKNFSLIVARLSDKLNQQFEETLKQVHKEVPQVQEKPLIQLQVEPQIQPQVQPQVQTLIKPQVKPLAQPQVQPQAQVQAQPQIQLQPQIQPQPQVVVQPFNLEKRVIIQDQAQKQQQIPVNIQKDSIDMQKSREIGQILNVAPDKYLNYVKQNQGKDVSTLISMLFDHGHI